MRRLRALAKLRRSAHVAGLLGRSWVRRAKEVRYGLAIMTFQAHSNHVVITITI